MFNFLFPKKNFYCCVCENKLQEFKLYGSPPRVGQCPKCGSKKRTRALAYYLEEVVAPKLKKGVKVLEIGLNQNTAKYFVNPRFLNEAIYTGFDIRSLSHHKLVKAPHKVIVGDATVYDFGENVYDLILCNHVFSAIPNDQAAMKNLHRALKPDGLAILNEAIEKDLEKSITQQQMKELHPELTQEYLDDNGVAWYYGADYTDRLKNAGFKLEFYKPFLEKQKEFCVQNGIDRDFVFFLGWK